MINSNFFFEHGNFNFPHALFCGKDQGDKVHVLVVGRHLLMHVHQPHCKCLGGTHKNFYRKKEHKQEFIILAEIRKMYRERGMKLLPNKVPIQGMEDYWLTKCINKNHNVWLYVSHMQPSLNK